MNIYALIAQLKIEEGFRSHPYQDSLGRTTIGYGRNLSDVGISMGEAESLLRHDIDEVVRTVPDAIPCYNTLNEVRQRVLIDMAFNMGLPTLLTFKRMLTYLRLGEWELAANEMEKSTWYQQVKGRAVKLTVMMRTGKDI